MGFDTYVDWGSGGLAHVGCQQVFWCDMSKDDSDGEGDDATGYGEWPSVEPFPFEKNVASVGVAGEAVASQEQDAHAAGDR